MVLFLCGAVALGGCAATAPSNDRRDAPRASFGAAVVDPEVKTVELADFGGETVCEQHKRPGSRIVADTVCYTPDAGASDDQVLVTVWSASGASSMTVGADRAGTRWITRDAAPRSKARAP
ncbi:MAG TPA: hypothetical protein VIN61_11495 [Gammaproteobacteria bacterium]